MIDAKYPIRIVNRVIYKVEMDPLIEKFKGVDVRRLKSALTSASPNLKLRCLGAILALGTAALL